MSTMITEECISCGACEPSAEPGHQPSRTTSTSSTPELCTECVGCPRRGASSAAVCPVDCCVPTRTTPRRRDSSSSARGSIHPDKESERSSPPGSANRTLTPRPAAAWRACPGNDGADGMMRADDAFRDGPSIPEAVPVFPLPNVVFFPHTILPLHIFEPRYRTMVADAERGDGCIAISLLREGWEKDYEAAPRTTASAASAG